MRRRISALAVVAGLASAPAFAHALLEHESPKAGAVLSAPPADVQLSFSEGLEPAFTGVTVTDATGKNFAAAAAKIDGQTMVLPLKDLPAGKYRVAWHAVSVDTHRTEGGYEFVVKN